MSNRDFDMERFEIGYVITPRHADGIVITGPITKAMTEAVHLCHDAVSDPKIIILTDACAFSGGIFQESPEIDRGFLEKLPIDFFYSRLSASSAYSYCRTSQLVETQIGFSDQYLDS